MLSISPSKINNYLQCPFKYKCEIDTDLRKKFKKDTAPLTFGNLIHGCLNDLYKRTEKNERDLNRLRELFEAKFKSNLEKHKKIFKTRENIIKYVELAKEMFKHFAESEFFNKEPLVTEDFPKYSLKDDLEISGKFDRVDIEGDQLTLVDYKTGKINEDEDNKFQLNFYELLLSKIYTKYQLKEKILYYLKDNKIIRYTPSGSLDKIEKEISDIARTINADKEFTPTPNDKCIYCDYKSICPMMNNENIQGNFKVTDIPF